MQGWMFYRNDMKKPSVGISMPGRSGTVTLPRTSNPAAAELVLIGVSQPLC